MAGFQRRVYLFVYLNLCLNLGLLLFFGCSVRSGEEGGGER